MLCDLQGGVYRDGAVLTDPVILSRNKLYGLTDLGPTGISSFFSRHVCVRAHRIVRMSRRPCLWRREILGGRRGVDLGFA